MCFKNSGTLDSPFLTKKRDHLQAKMALLMMTFAS
jgi:hypothetical protein